MGAVLQVQEGQTQRSVEREILGDNSRTGSRRPCSLLSKTFHKLAVSTPSLQDTP